MTKTISMQTVNHNDCQECVFMTKKSIAKRRCSYHQRTIHEKHALPLINLFTHIFTERHRLTEKLPNISVKLNCVITSIGSKVPSRSDACHQFKEY